MSFTHVVLPGLSWSLPSWLGIIGAVMFVVWMTNLFNFMDGMDGLAGGMSTIGFSTYAILGYQSGDQAFLATSLVIAAASAGFLVFNFPPAKIFMGDVGSSTLGLLAGALTLWGSSQQLFPLWARRVGVFSLHRRCHRDLDCESSSRRACVGSSQNSLLSAPGAQWLESPTRSVMGVRIDGCV